MVVPPAAIWSIGLAGAAMLAKLVVRQWQRVHAGVKTVPVANAEREALPKLRRDPVTGVYRP